jgi:hypothetical protein
LTVIFETCSLGVGTRKAQKLNRSVLQEMERRKRLCVYSQFPVSLKESGEVGPWSGLQNALQF